MTTQFGSCHCGNVRFEVDGDPEDLEVCNCSLCARGGYVQWYVSPDSFRLLTPEENLATYRFGTMTSLNHFCRDCGMAPFRVPRSDPDKIAVNVRCLEGVDAESLSVERFDGQHWEAAMGRR